MLVIILILISGSAFAFEGIFMSKMYRTYAPEKVSAVRSFAFLLTQLPVVLWKAAEFSRISEILWMVLLASFFTYIGNSFWGATIRKLPVGISGAVSNSVMSVAGLVLALSLFNEKLTMTQYICVSALISGVVLMSLTKHAPSEQCEAPVRNMKVGVILGTACGIFCAAGNTFMAMGAKTVHPFVAVYLWEGLAGVIGGGILLVTQRESPFKGIGLKGFLQIALRSSPAVVGAVLFGYAVTIAPVGVVNASVIGSSVIGTSILGFFMLKERLTPKQVALLLVLVGAIVLLKLV